MDLLTDSFDASNLAAWTLLVMGAFVCAVMGVTPVWRASPAQFLAAAGTLVAVWLLGAWGLTDYYLAFLIISGCAMGPVVLAHVVRGRRERVQSEPNTDVATERPAMEYPRMAHADVAVSHSRAVRAVGRLRRSA
ncbi:MAG: hypothetical protein CMJ31_01185 [Phycisphaerae bacterium]|nr:hypothetical protein [Phycisphaerae bacterium]